MTALTGSIGLLEDTKLALQTSCQPAPGHQWDPAERLDWWTEGPVALHPKCKECQDQLLHWLQEHGLERFEINRVRQAIGMPKVHDGSKPTTSEGGAVTSEEGIIMLGGTYLDYLRLRERKAREKAERDGGFDVCREARKVGDHIHYVPELTDWHRARNIEADQLREAVIEMREKALDEGMPASELPWQFPMPEVIVYRQEG